MLVGLTGVARGTCSRWWSILFIRERVRVPPARRCCDSKLMLAGYATILMEDGFRRASPEPVHLEATTAFSRDIYLHYGFEVRTRSFPHLGKNSMILTRVNDAHRLTRSTNSVLALLMRSG